MTSFLSASCCNGRRPRRWMGATIHPRPDLVSRLMRERQVARFLVAPPGYGKTFLALEYAQVVFGFNQVSWIDARSPCFLRDLDRGTLADDVMKRDKDMRLVVFDDVPRLGAQRADLLSAAIDGLLEAGSEVMVLCHPSSDAFAGRQIDRICLTARDLMLDANECSGAGERNDGPWADVPGFEGEAQLSVDLARLIPQLAWGSADAPIRFAEAIAREELPDEVLGVQFLLLILGDASISGACGSWEVASSQVEALEHDYPHFGVRSEEDQIASVLLAPDVLVRAYAAKLKRVAQALAFETPDALGFALADALMELGDYPRACEVAVAMVGKALRAEWLLGNERRLSRSLCLLPAWRLGRSLGTLRADAAGSRLEVQQAWRLVLLGDARTALLVASRVASRATAPFSARISALVMIAHFGNETLRSGALDRLSVLVEGVVYAGDDAVAQTIESEVALALCLVERHDVERTLETGRPTRQAVATRLAQVWFDVASSCIDGEASLLAATMVLDLCPALADDEAFRRFLDNGEEDAPVGVYRLEAYRVLNDLVRHEGAGADAAASVLSDVVKEQARRAERVVALQQQEYGALMRAQEKRRTSRSSSVRSSDAASESRLPHLQISLFGGIEAVLDGRHLEPDDFNHTKMRAMLAILTMAGGREVSRDRLVSALWPASTQRTAQKNLYTNWAALKRTLSLPDGSCPFLHHVQGSYRIDGRLVTSDVQQVAAVCRALAIEKPDPDRFRALLDDLNRLYRGDLLPSEVKCDAIIDAREEYRSQVSDALVQASFRLLDMGEYQMALWFARSALEHERRQEDPYYALMSAQIACGQREAALETYRVCSRALTKAFSIDPSQRMVNLYRQITECEESF